MHDPKIELYFLDIALQNLIAKHSRVTVFNMNGQTESIVVAEQVLTDLELQGLVEIEKQGINWVPRITRTGKIRKENLEGNG